MTAQYLASHEIAFANVEQLLFDNIPNVRDVKPDGSPGDGMAIRLVAAQPDKRIGTAIMMRVMPGDQFNISAKSYYNGDFSDEGSVGAGDVVASLMSTLIGGNTYGGTPVGEMADNVALIGQALSGSEVAQQIGALTVTDEDPSAPKAYLNYLFFDDQMKLIPEASGKVQIKSNMGGPGTWETLRPSNNNTLTVKCTVCPPFSSAVIYVDNQSLGKEVWFDDLFIGHYKSDVLEENHYYPFGLTLAYPFDDNVTPNPYKLTTKELERSFGMEMYDFGARLQDPQLGRWFGVDELSEKYFNSTPYSFCGNNPIVFADIDGRDYGLYIKDVITIKLTLHTSNLSNSSAQQSADRINSQSGSYEWVVGSGESERTFPINFEVSVSPTINLRDSKIAFNADKSGESNDYEVLNDNDFDKRFGKELNGNTSSGSIIKVRSSREDTETGSHEVGHAMGIVHNNSKGLMTPDGKRKGDNSSDLQMKDVSDAIKFPLKGKVNYEYQDNQKKEAGKGHVVNESGDAGKPALSNDEISKGYIRKIN